MQLRRIVGCLVIASIAFISKPIAEASHSPTTSLEIIVNADYKLKRERDCLVEALYHEARGESDQGVKAVLSVIHNRKTSKIFKGDTYCKIIASPKQFSYRNHLSENTVMKVQWKPVEKHRKELITSLANKAALGMFQPVNSVILWYHTTTVNPVWNRKLQSIKIGNHLFFYKKALNEVNI